MDKATTLLSITSDQYANLKPLVFNIGKESYSLSPNGQIWPRSLNTQIGGSASGIYLIVSDVGTKSGSGMDFFNGYTFLYVLGFPSTPKCCCKLTCNFPVNASTPYMIPPTTKLDLPGRSILIQCPTDVAHDNFLSCIHTHSTFN